MNRSSQADPGKVKPLKDILPDLYRRQKRMTEEDEEELVRTYWPSTVGPQIARRTRPVRILKGRLIVDIEGQEWRRQLAPMGRTIARQLNGAVGKDVLEDVEFRVMVPNIRPPGRAQTATGTEDSHQRQDEASGIEDPNLRRIYRRSIKKTVEK